MSEQLKAASQSAQTTDKSKTGWWDDLADKIPKIDTGNGDLAQSHYKFKYLVFPTDIGMNQMGHYMVININVPVVAWGETPAGNYTNQFTPINPTQRSKVDTLRYGPVGSGTSLIPGGPSPLPGGQQRPVITVPRSTKRIQESIALYMPTPLVYTHNNEYEEIGLTALAGRVGAAAGSWLGKVPVVGGFLGGLGGIIGKITQPNGDAAQVAKIAQNPINPAVEILFSTTAIRQFTMEVLMAPKNEYESETMKAIIKTMRFHGAAELNSMTGGMTWIPPAEFDITFFNRGVENLHILRMNTCILDRIEVDYAPASGVYSTFTNGHPVAVRMQLGFREIEPLHKLRVLQGF